MGKKPRRMIAAATAAGILTALILASSALAQDASPSPADDEIVFVAGTTNDMRTVNPFAAFETPEFAVMDLNYDLLLTYAKEDLAPVPNLATDWTQSEDGLTWTFNLRDDVTWHDGEPFTAEDVVFTYTLVVENELSGLSYLPSNPTFEVVDDNTFTWTTEEPTTSPLAPPYVYILPEHIWGDMTVAEVNKFKNYPNMIGTGPFQLTDWEKGQSWTMEANPDYFGGAPKIDKYIVRKYDNEEAMATALREGEIDIMSDVSIDVFESLQGVEGITTSVGPLSSFDQMSFPLCQNSTAAAGDVDCKKSTTRTGHPALLDPEVRRAIALAIDKETIVDRVLQGYGSVGTTVIPPFNRWHAEPAEVIPFDPAEANRILDAGGYLDADGDGVREMPGGGDPLDFRFYVRSERTETVTEGEFISGWLQDIGIATKIEAVTDDKLTDIYLANDFDLYIWGWGVEPDPDFQLSTYTTRECGYWSDTCYANPQYDALYEQQQTAVTPEERAPIVEEMQQVVYDDIPQIVLDYYATLEAYDSAEWAGLEENKSPQPQGWLWEQYGRHTALTVIPRRLVAADAPQPAGDTGISAGVWLAVLGGVVLIVGIVALVRRGRSEEDRA